MKIVHAISSLDPAMGGPPAVAIALAAAQRAAGPDVTLLSATAPDRREASLATFAATPGVDRVQQHWVDGPVSAAAAFGGRSDPAVVAAVEQHDVVHIHGVWEPVLMQVANAARRLGRPYVVAPHGMLTAWCLTQKRWKKRIALAAGYRRMLAGAAFLHLLNRDEDRRTRLLNGRVARQVVPNGMFLQEVDPLPPRGGVERFFPQLAGKPYVLFLARLHSVKGLDTLADAFARVAGDRPGVRLAVAGPDGGAQRDLERQVGELGLTDRVDLLGPVYGEAKRSLLGDAHCFSLPSRHETFSMSITEAMAFRVPVVITDTCHFPEVADVGAGRVVPVGDAEAIADALLEVLADPALAERQGEAGRRLVEERYTWERVTERFLALYQPLVGGRPTPTAEPAVR